MTIRMHHGTVRNHTMGFCGCIFSSGALHVALHACEYERTLYIHVITCMYVGTHLTHLHCTNCMLHTH